MADGVFALPDQPHGVAFDLTTCDEQTGRDYIAGFAAVLTSAECDPKCVAQAFDVWLKSEKFAPTPSDIVRISRRFEPKRVVFPAPEAPRPSPTRGAIRAFVNQLSKRGPVGSDSTPSCRAVSSAAPESATS